VFKVNDYIVYGLTGVCQITDIEKDKDINGNEIDYYVLRPVYNNINNMIIKLPMNNPKLSIRAILTKDEALSLITTMPEQETIWTDDDRQRNANFKTALRSGKNEEWIKIINTLYLEREARSVDGRKLNKTDEEILSIAENHLNQELAIALNISPDEVVSYILEHIPDNKV